MSRRERRAAIKRIRKEGELDQQAFLETAGQFIDLANRMNRTIVAPDLALALDYAAARYNAHVARNVLEVEKHEEFVEEALKRYAEMLRQNLADPDL
jgi:cytosine/adenosine deaminase-related metal-dependent hydrolase